MSRSGGATLIKASLMPTQIAGLPTKTVRGLLSATRRRALGDYDLSSELQNGNKNVGSGRLSSVLEGFPLVHQVANLPHEAVVAIERRFC